MAERHQIAADFERDAVFDGHVAAAKSFLGEARRFEGHLNIHPVVHDVGNELRVRLRLVQAAHDSEAHVHVALFHEGRDDGVEGPLARRQRVGMAGRHRE